ncbi:MAG: serine/threonine-protein kinase [Verrucomicrobiales bacterium]
MIAARQCPACGSSTPVDAPRGLCVECLMRLAEDPSPTLANEDAMAAENGAGAGRFGDYDLLRQIGRGGMGVVYEARQLSLNRIVALKMILGGDLASMSPPTVRRFKVEAEAAAKLTHPNIVAIHEFGEHDGLPFFTMQRIDGPCLDTEMAALALPSVAGKDSGKDIDKTAAGQAQVRIAKLVATLARALHYAHEQGVIHCDVKPSNILIDNGGEPHLTDFGIARLLDQDGQLTKSGVIGSPRYMSPEQASGRRGEVTGATDIYGLGVVLYELLTGRPPFRAVTPSETLLQVMEQEPPDPHDSHPLVNRDLSIICLKCLEKNVLHRYASAAELADDLERWIRHEPIRARLASPPERLLRWCQRKPAIATLAASVAALLMTVAILSFLVAWNLFEKEKERAASEERQEALRLAGVEKDEAVRRIARDAMNRELDELWEYSGKQYVDISADTRWAVMGGDPPPFHGVVESLTFGVYTFQTPSKMAKQFLPLLGNLEQAVAAQLKRPVRINFVIYRSYKNGHDGLLSGEVDFMRMGPNSYVELKNSLPGISLLAAQEDTIRCWIFTRANSGITELNQLEGKSFAFGARESTFGTILAKVALLDVGIRKDILIGYHFRSHDEVVDAVMEKGYAAGSANFEVIRKMTEPNSVKMLHDFPNDPGMPMPFVAGEDLDPAVREALRNALLAERSESVLSSIAPNLSGFREVKDEEYDLFRKRIEQAREFGELEEPVRPEVAPDR